MAFNATPPPWEATHHNDETRYGGPGYYSVDGPVMEHRNGVVCDTLNRDHTISPEEDHANAKLIAESHDLLIIAKAYIELAESIVSNLDGREGEYGERDWPGLPDALKNAQTVVARAEGRAS